MTDDIEKTLEDIEALFAQTAHEMTTDGDRVTFHKLSPSTLYFSDRPQRVVGHLTTKQFVDEWDKGDNSFAEDPPNAVISFVEKGDETPEDAIVVLKDPQIDGDSLTYTVDMLEGSLPAEGRAGVDLHRSLRAAALAGVGGRHAPSRPAAPLSRRRHDGDGRREWGGPPGRPIRLHWTRRAPAPAGLGKELLLDAEPQTSGAERRTAPQRPARRRSTCSPSPRAPPATSPATTASSSRRNGCIRACARA